MSTAHHCVRPMLRSARPLALFVLLAFLGTSSCVLESTEVLVVVDTDAPIERDLALTASIGLPGSSTPTQRTWVRGSTIPDSTRLPASFAIVPASAEQESETVTLVLHAHVAAGAAGSAPIDFDRTARFRFVHHQTSVLRIFLPVECGTLLHGCTSVPDAQCTLAQLCADTGQTCNNAAICVPPDVDPVPVTQDDGSVNGGPPPDVVHADVQRFDTAIDAGMDVASRDSAQDAQESDVRTDVPVVDTCECTPGATRTVSCGACASETDTCSSSCAWVAGSCNGSCCTPMAGCVGGNGVGGVCTGNGDDGCGGACTCNAVNGEQCSVGSGTGTCCHTSGWFCSDQSQCCPGLTCSGNICG